MKGVRSRDNCYKWDSEYEEHIEILRVMIEHHKVSATTQVENTEGGGSMGGDLVSMPDTKNTIETKSVSNISSDNVTGNKANLAIQGPALEEKFKIIKILDSLVEFKSICLLVCETFIRKNNDGYLQKDVCVEEHRVYDDSCPYVLVYKKRWFVFFLK